VVVEEEVTSMPNLSLMEEVVGAKVSCLSGALAVKEILLQFLHHKVILAAPALDMEAVVVVVLEVLEEIILLAVHHIHQQEMVEVVLL
jgi:hypothetical protein